MPPAPSSNVSLTGPEWNDSVSRQVPDLCHQAEVLIASDPDLLAAIYDAAFSYQETSQETTQMGSAVVPLSSHRAQDYGHAHYRLGEAYAEFLKGAPVEAIAALIAVRTAYGQRRAESLFGDSIVVALPGSAEITILNT